MRSPPSDPPPSEARSGAMAAGVCYFLWGLVPLYWKPLAAVNPVELIAHRHVWSLVLLLILLLGLEGGYREMRGALGSARGVARLLLSAVLLTANWLVYVWGVSTGRIVETSLGYFLVPLVNAAAGRFVLHEHLRRAQQVAIGVAAVGVGL
ncbi:MAG: EamA family transporter, partial [Verrucomicrobiae bacterium]|nr:EamA family transporter [Verrucomicrobiae bacterium]